MAGYIQLLAEGTRGPQVDHVAKTGARVLTNGDALFIAYGDVQIVSLLSECYTANGAGATTLQYAITKNAVTTTLGNASASLANDPIGSTVILAATAALTENMIHTVASGVGLNTASRGIRFPTGGVLSSVVAVGPSTGTWKHYLRWEPLEDGAVVVPQF
jgi:hypothetical protein